MSAKAERQQKTARARSPQCAVMEAISNAADGRGLVRRCRDSLLFSLNHDNSLPGIHVYSRNPVSQSPVSRNPLPRVFSRVSPRLRWLAILATPLAAWMTVSAQSEPPSLCATEWEQSFPPVGTAYTDPLTGCTGIYEVVYHDEVVTPSRGDVTASLREHPEFSNRTCLTGTCRISRSVTTCDSFGITGEASFGGSVSAGVETEAGIVFASAKAEMQVAYTAEFAAGEAWTGSRCEEFSWGGEMPHHPCTVMTFRLFQEAQPTSATSRGLTEFRIRFLDACDLNGAIVLHQCVGQLTADLLGQQSPVDAPGAGWHSWPIEDCHCPGDGTSACVDRPRLFGVSSIEGQPRLKLSINEWIEGIEMNCDLDWVDALLSDPALTVEVD